MRYLQNRERFIIQLKEAQKYGIVGEEILLKEVFENDITWGGSLLGRLINSSIRRFKIGYNQVKIDPLLKKLEDEMNYLVSASLQGDTLKKYNELLIRSYFEQIKNVCLSNNTEDEKLDELLGQHKNLYDPNDPTKNQRTLGIVQEALDVITDDLKDLKKISGVLRDQLIDKLSDFNDDLRKLTVDAGTPVQPSQSRASNFNVNFSNVLQASLSNQLITDSNGSFLKYDLFVEKVNIENLKRTIEDRKRQISEEKDERKKELLQNELNNAEERLNSILKKQGNTNNQGNPNMGVVKYSDKDNKKDNNKNQSDSQPTKDEGKNIESKKPSKGEVDKVLNILKTKKDAKKDPDVINLLSKLSSEIKPMQKSSKIKVKYNEDESSLKDAIDRLEKDINESFIYESSNLLPQPGSSGSTASGSTASGNTGNTSPSSTGTSNKKTVQDVWNEYEFDKNQISRLTQREVDELNSMLSKGAQDMRYEPQKRPDPIVSIARIFREAHNIYSTDVIPSGRPNGRISQKTFREYYKLGKGPTKWTSDAGPEGPFAVKSIFNKWKTGVEKLLQNQEYRKILANIKFVVPGAEDTFNDNYNTKVFEADELGTTDKSSGQILFQFMNDMLDKNKLDDFDTLESTLLNKYFGIKMSDKDKRQKVSRPERQPNKEDIEDNIVYWKELQNPKIDITKSKFYAVPIKKFTDGRGQQHDLMFIQAIRKETINGKEAFLIRFTYDDPIIMSKYADLKLPNNKYYSWKQKDTKGIYYGFMNKSSITSGSKFTVVYGNVNSYDDKVSDIYDRTFEVEFGSRTFESGESVDVRSSKLVYNENSAIKDIILPQGFEGVKLSLQDKKTHTENLDKIVNINGTNKKLIEALKDKFIAIP